MEISYVNQKEFTYVGVFEQALPAAEWEGATLGPSLVWCGFNGPVTAHTACARRRGGTSGHSIPQLP
jgi:hypothetical protein